MQNVTVNEIQVRRGQYARGVFIPGPAGQVMDIARQVRNQRANQLVPRRVITVTDSVAERKFQTEESLDEVSRVFGPVIQAINMRRAAAQPAVAPASTPPTSVADELKKLVELRDLGALNEEEFSAQKAKLLG